VKGSARKRVDSSSSQKANAFLLVGDKEIRKVRRALMYVRAERRVVYQVVCHAGPADCICCTSIRWVGWRALAILVVVFGMVIVPLPSWGQIFGSSAVPAVLNGSAGGSIELGMKFTADQAGTINAIRFYKSPSDSSTQHVANLWSSTGTLLASATSASETASGWQQVNLTSAAPIAANAVYVISYHTPGSYAATYGYFNIPVDNPPLHAVVNSASNPNGVFLYGASSAFPVNNGFGTNYWVDVAFTPSTGSAALVSLQVNSSTSSIALGSKQQFKATGTFSDNSTQDLTSQVTWSSGTPSVATISSGGLATGIGQGSSTITATLTSISAMTTLTVTGTSSLPPSSNSTYTLFTDSATPALASNAGSPLELGMLFTADQAGTVSALRFYKSPSDSSTQHAANLWSSTGTLLASATSANETASGWQQVDLASAVPIAANTVYVVSYHTPGSYAATYGYFNTAVDNPPLHAAVNSASSPNGVYLYSSNNAFPVANGYGANYWVDVVFMPSTGTASLVSLNITPTSPSLVIGSTQQFHAIGSFSDNSTQDLTTQVSWSSGSPSVATITSGGLASGIGQGSSLITATAPGGISGTTTATVTSPPPQSGTTYTLFSPTAIPAQNLDAGFALELGMKFTANQNGSISALRFYKGYGNTGTHVGNLWSSTGQLLATVTFNNETASGWQQVNLASPVAISANTVYVVSYFSASGSFSATWGYFNQPVDNPPLHAVVNSASNGNGVYVYGTSSAFPTYSGYGANYWVDVVFTPSTGVQVPLSITNLTLPGGQVNSAYSTAVTATGGTAPYTWSISSGVLPTGLSLATGTGVISGTPSASGTFNVTLAVHDAQGVSTTANFSITIAASLQITTTSLPSGVVGSPYDATLAATGGTPPYTWGIASGSLPSSLALAATTGTISGTPSTSGTFTPTVQVTDSANNTVTQPYSFAISDPAYSVQLTWTASPTTTVTGYNIYRGTGGGYSKMNSSPVPELAYTDLTVVIAQTYYYAVTAVDASGDESAYSADVQINVP